MQYKGFNFRRTKAYVVLPKEHDVNGPHMTFGKICTQDTEGAVETDYHHNIDCKFGKRGEKVFALPLPCQGHSRTNMMYSGKNIYMMEGGKFYVAKING